MKTAMELRVTINALAQFATISGEANRLRLEALALVDRMEDEALKELDEIREYI